MDYDVKRKMNKKELIEFLRRLSDEIEEDSSITFPDKEKISIKNPVFIVEYEFSEKEYGKKLEIDIQMKDYE